MQALLGYSKWKNFEKVIQKAKDACKNAGEEIAYHFPDVGKMVTIGSGAEKEIDDILLTRYACYLVAQNGDSRKQEIAFAQNILSQNLPPAEDVKKQQRKLDGDEKKLLKRKYFFHHWF